jgi:branched-chain amino acid transport system substrate-binding protein
MGFSVGPSIPDFESTLKGDSNAVMGGTQWPPALKFQGDDLFKTPEAYNNLYKQTFNHEPSYQSAESTAAGVAYVKAIEKAGTLDTDKVREEISKLNFTSFCGIQFDERGINATKPMAVEQWQGSRRACVAADVAEGKAVWPFPTWSNR